MGEAPSVKAYDAYVKACVVPFCQTCDDLQTLGSMGRHLQDAWEGIRTIVVLASRSKAPLSGGEDLPTALAPYLTQTQDAVKQLREMRLDRNCDRHHKAVLEMLAALSWVLHSAPRQLPGPSVKEALGSAEFWSNRIRKDYKGSDDVQVAFCDGLKKVLTGLVEYIEEYHKAGLSFNPKGTSLAEAAIRLADEPNADTDAALLRSPVSKRHPTIGSAAPGGNLAGLMDELNKRKSEKGDSAATGLKHVRCEMRKGQASKWEKRNRRFSHPSLLFILEQVTKDQQTWRQEYKKGGPSGGDAAPALPTVPSLDGTASSTKKEEKKKKLPLSGLPIFEYQDRGFKWVVENHTKESVIKEASPDGILTIDITDPKQQVYLYNCDGVALKVTGKFKSLILDKCKRCSVVYDTLISSAEMVNCEKIKIQVNGVCPVFTIDKTKNVLVWLSQESIHVSSFTTSLSTEMNVTFPDGDDMKELPIPEQFVHKLGDTLTLSTDVSDLYH